MSWFAYGTKLGWNPIEGQEWISFQADWHEFLPDITGRSPDFEIDEVLELQAKKLSLRIRVGDENRASNELKMLHRLKRIPFEESAAGNIDAIVYLSEGEFMLDSFVSKRSFTDLLGSVHAFCSGIGPRFFQISLPSRFGSGKYSLGVSPEEKAAFLNGEISAWLALQPVGVSFVYGERVPSQPSQSELLSKMKRRFGV